MKSLLIALLFASTTAFATGLPAPNIQSQGQSQGQGQEQAQLQGQAQGQGQAQNITFKPVIDVNARARAESNSNSESSANLKSTNTNVTGTSVDASSGSVTNNQVYQDRTGRNTPAFGLGTVYPTSPCMGSSQVGGSGVGFSIGVGTSWTDDECGIRETARSFQGMGLNADGLSILCTSKYAAAAPSCKKEEK